MDSSPPQMTAVKSGNSSFSSSISPPETRRFLVLLILIAQQIVNTVLWISFSPIAIEVSSFYDVDIQFVNTLSTSCLLMFPFGMVWCSYLGTKFGFREVMIIASGLNLASGVLRCISHPIVFIAGGHAGYAVLLVGQMLSAFAQPVFTNSPVRLANDWFPETERDLATTVGNIGFGLGNVVAMGIPAACVAVDPSTQAISGVGTLLSVECVLCVIGFIWCWGCFADEPKSPPSRSAAEKRQLRKQGTGIEESGSSMGKVLGDYKKLLTDFHFVALLSGFSIVLGGFNALFTDLEQLVKPAGYSVQDTSLFGNTFIVTGFVTAAAAGIYLDKTHRYVCLLKACFFALLIACCNFMLSIRPDSRTQLCVASALFGAASLPILPTTLATAGEVTYPLPEEASSGLLILGGNYFGVIFSYAFAALLKLTPKFNGVFTPAAIFTMVTITISTFAVFLFNGENKRQAADVQRRSSKSRAESWGDSDFTASFGTSPFMLATPLLASGGEQDAA